MAISEGDVRAQALVIQQLSQAAATLTAENERLRNHVARLEGVIASLESDIRRAHDALRDAAGDVMRAARNAGCLGLGGDDDD